jgi:tetratricopeptide (TPR) repeat protein
MARPSQEQIAMAVEAFIHAQMWNDCKSIFEAYYDLLWTNDADIVLANLLEQKKNDENANYLLEERRELLARCRRDGIGGIIAYYIHNDVSLKPLLNEIIQLKSLNDLSRRIQLCRTALQYVNRDTKIHLWIYLQNDLAKNLVQNSGREHTSNLEQAISHCKQALEILTCEAFPADWAMAHHNMGNAYLKYPRGEHGDNLELAISHYKQALVVRTRETFPEDWAATNHNLGNAYYERVQGESAENLELAISYYVRALEVRTRHSFPADWAMTQGNLASAYPKRVRGERADNLELAISHCKQALEVYMRQAYPEEWAEIENGLGDAFSDRIQGERAENLEQAIQHHQQALEVYTRQAFPEDWAMTQNELGNAYYKRIRGERADNLEQAISHYEQCLEVITRQTYPELWAIIRDNVATAYQDRIRGERADNLELAISHYEQALKVLDEPTHEASTFQAFPEDWATLQNNLGTAYLYRVRGEHADNLELAISHYDQALKVRTRQAFPEDWAATQNNLALAYQYRIRGEHADNLEQAISYFEQALEVSTHQAFPEDWARTQNNLALAYLMRVHGEHAGNLEQAILYYQHALEVYTPISFPQNCRDTAYSLGCLFYDEHRFLESRHALSIAHQGVEALRGEVQRDIAKRALADENADLYARLVSCCLRENDEAAAFEYAVAGKGRAFVDLLATARFELSASSVNDPALKEDLQIARKLRQQIDKLLVTLTGDSAPTSTRLSSSTGVGTSLATDLLRAQLRALQSQAASFWEEMAYKYPTITATQKAPILSVNLARTLAAELNTTLVEYYRHKDGWCAFVFTSNVMYHVPLPLINDILLERMTRWIQWLGHPEGRNLLSYKPLSEWYDAVIAPLETYFPKGESIIIAPFGALHALPLAAARHPKTGHYVAEDYQIAFVPSLSALRTVWDESRRTNGDGYAVPQRLLSVAYPGMFGSNHYLPNVLPEAQTISKYFAQVTELYQEKATPDAILEHSHEQDVVHFGCHGWFDPAQPEQSGLMLAGGWLTVQRIITELRLEQTHVATLGTCLSGRIALKRGDEHIGLLQAMLTTGVHTVVTSLWSVDDAATRTLIEVFYAELVLGHPPARAMQEAARIIRGRPSWEHPYYWAAFQVSGLSHGSLQLGQLPSRINLTQSIE